MPIRPARFSDHNAMAMVCTRAFFDEDLFGRLKHPRRSQYPDDPALFWHALIRECWFDWRNRVFVAITTDAKDGGKETIVGISIWQRQGEGGERMALKPYDPRQ